MERTADPPDCGFVTSAGSSRCSEAALLYADPGPRQGGMPLPRASANMCQACRGEARANQAQELLTVAKERLALARRALTAAQFEKATHPAPDGDSLGSATIS
jgi:hypothetical protein